MITGASKKKRRVGFLGGTFDPIHFGHINLAIELKEKANLDEVWFCPTHISPFRVNIPPVTGPKKRAEMIRLAIGDIKGFSLNEIELHRPPPSYTVDTIKQLQAEHPDVHFYLLLGEDSLLGLEAWKGVEELISLAPPLIACRRSTLESELKTPSLPHFLEEKVQKGEIQTNYIDISSSSIRKRLKERLYCGHLLPGKVLDYIYKNQLYSSNN